MIKDTISKLYIFVARLVLMLEEDLEESKSKNDIELKKNITTTLNKLVVLITQLNKLHKEQEIGDNVELPEEDIDIIDKFLEKYGNNK
jgi:hypothetical protein